MNPEDLPPEIRDNWHLACRLAQEECKLIDVPLPMHYDPEENKIWIPKMLVPLSADERRMREMVPLEERARAQERSAACNIS